MELTAARTSSGGRFGVSVPMFDFQVESMLFRLWVASSMYSTTPEPPVYSLVYLMDLRRVHRRKAAYDWI